MWSFCKPGAAVNVAVHQQCVSLTIPRPLSESRSLKTGTCRSVQADRWEQRGKQAAEDNLDGKQTSLSSVWHFLAVGIQILGINFK